MNQQELQKKIHTLAAFIDGHIAADNAQNRRPEAPESDTDKAIRAVAMSGIQVVGELLMDIKRIADAAEKGAETLQAIARG